MDDSAIPISALQHFLYCPRQCGLIHLEQAWAENIFTAEGRVLHERVDEIKAEKRRGVRVVSSMPLSSEKLGIAGIADMVEFTKTPDGERAYPVEFKHGKPKEHRADEAQLCAQALCLEDMLQTPVERGALFYGKTRRRKEIVFDAELRSLTLSVIQSVREMFAKGETPKTEYSAKRCKACSLLELCEPEILNRKTSVKAWLSEQIREEADHAASS
jgi:CRISPR-associated exonuclease Cas4